MALSTVKISKLFSKSSKAPPGSIIETANTNYNFVCVCKSNYIGRCHRPLDHQIKEHYMGGKHSNYLHLHITSCPEFMKNLRKILRASKSSQLKPMQVYKIKLDFFRSKFSIIAKNFKSYFDRVDSEAYYIRTLNPDLNCQKKHKRFAIF